MFEAFTPGYRAGKKPRTIRLSLEELEGRCLLSGGPGITVGPDGHVWFVEPAGSGSGGAGAIGELDPATGLIQQFSVPAGTNMIGGLTLGPDGSVWFSTFDSIDELNPATGAVQVFSLPGRGNTGMWVSITVGKDGNVWFPFENSQGAQLGQLNPQTGQIQQFALPAGSYFNDVAVGPDGSLWLSHSLGNTVSVLDRFNPQTGAMQTFSVPAEDVTFGQDGKLWFTLSSGVETLDPSTGQITPYSLPAGHHTDAWITTDVNGNIWFAGYGPGAANYELGEVNTSAQVNIVSFPGAIGGMATGPDGNLWFSPFEDRLGDFVLAQYNPATGSFQFFDAVAKSGSPGNSPPAASNNSVSATGKNVSALAGINFMGAVATLTPQVPIVSPGQAYQVTINWGDGTTSRIVLSITENGTYDVIAGHTYEKAGTYTIKVTIGTYNPSNPLGDNPITVFGTANVDPFVMNMW